MGHAHGAFEWCVAHEQAGSSIRAISAAAAITATVAVAGIAGREEGV